jgi:phosphatidate cytidylyltransferase
VSQLLKRSVSGVVYALVIAVGLLGPQPCFVVVFGALTVMALYEFYRMSMGREFRAGQVLFCAGALAFFLTIYLSRLGLASEKWVYASLIPVLAAVVLPVWSGDCSKYGRMAYGVAGLFFTALPLALTPVLCVQNGVYSGLLLLDIFIIVSLSDVGAYCFGCTLGRLPGAHRMAPHISANKSWWGFAGGIVFACLGATLLKAVGLLETGWLHTLAFAAVMSVIADLGDLVESMWKRFFGVKDSGNVIPGHGGVYDRLDSMMLAIPVAVLYLKISGLLL